MRGVNENGGWLMPVIWSNSADDILSKLQIALENNFVPIVLHCTGQADNQRVDKKNHIQHAQTHERIHGVQTPETTLKICAKKKRKRFQVGLYG